MSDFSLLVNRFTLLLKRHQNHGNPLQKLFIKLLDRKDRQTHQVRPMKQSYCLEVDAHLLSVEIFLPNGPNPYLDYLNDTK